MSNWNEKLVTETDKVRSRTSLDLGGLRGAADVIAKQGAVNRFLDIGCGFGGLANLVGTYLEAEEIHGLDIDPRVEAECKSKGVITTIYDAEEKLPYDDGTFDAVMSLGMMDYLPFFDGMVREMNRILVPGGLVLVSLPNLGSWHNRVQLLRGYQPRDIEFSNELLAGAAPTYRNAKPSGHIHIPTVRGFRELMAHHGFEEVAVTAGQPTVRSKAGRLTLAVDRLLSRRVTLARRFYYVGRQVRSVPVPERSNSLPYQLLD